MNVSDWLGENNKLGIDIWEKKYCHNNETFDEWLDRVSCGDDKLKDTIINKEFLFGGRILSNRGLFEDGTKVTYSNCFTAGHNVITNRGIKKIEDVVVGDMVLSHDLTYNRVNEILSHVYSGNLITLTINGVEDAITCTPNHQFLTFEAGWVEAQNLTFNHHILLANRKGDDYSSYNDIVSISVSQDAVELVYNLSVENTHTYNVNGVVVHNCYVISPPEDNIESIFECASKLARTYSFGGGCGVDIGKLAPRGAKVHNTAKETSGAVSFMDLYSLVTGLIGQNGRRGALMLSMPCNHPDIEEFIEVKSDLDRVTKANISIRITDDFIEAVKQDKPYKLSFTRKETGETIEKIVNAKKLFEKLAEMNWDYAEPGCLFWDRIEKYNLLGEDSEFEYAGTNPCVTGDTLVQTTYGEIPIKELVGKTPYVYCMDENGNIAVRQASKVWKTRENAQLVRVETKRGCIRCTPNHLIYTRNRGWVEAQDLKHGDKITGLNRQMKDETHVSIGLSGTRYVPEHRLIMGAFYDISGMDVHHKDGDTLHNVYDNLEVLEHGEHSKISNTGRKINSVRDKKGRYVNKKIKSKCKSLNLGCGVGTNWTVENVIWLENKEDVYDMTVPEVHNFVANRMVVHNCAEEPLPAGGSCLLGSINLSAFVTENKLFNYSRFIEVVRTSVRALNDVLDEGLPLHPLKEQQDSVRDWRQIGLGIMGLADMLIKLEIPYGSKESISICDEIGRIMAVTAIDESSKIAKEQGKYPKYKEVVRNSEFYKYHIDNSETKEIDEHVKKYGIRNSQLLTIAPTGTLSTMLQISGGIEPIFANFYERTTQSLHGKDVIYKVYTKIVGDYMKEHGINDDKDLPEWFVTAQTLDYRNRIEMQSVWQSHIDASISSTVNVPNSFTKEQTFDLYMYAHDMGLKGVTIFRDGCKRTAILNTHSKKEDSKPSELGRGMIIDVSDNVIGKKRKLMTGCGSLHCEAFFDPDTGELLETYLSKGSTGGCNNFMIGLSRMISLSARSGCDIHSIVDQLNSCGACPSYAVRRATKGDTSKGSCCPMAVGNALIDMYNELQDELGLSDEKVYQQSEIRETTITNITDIKAKCPECGEPLTFEGGCNICKNCGWSKCG